MEFSKRTPWDLSANRLAMAREAYSGEVLDLTQSNPTQCGIEYPSQLLDSLADPSSRSYDPDPLGLPSAREAVTKYLKTRGLEVESSRILLTSGTSEAFSYVLKLLGDPGDDFLVPAPGYPLFEHLASLEGLGTRPYRHKVEEGWSLDRDSIVQGKGRIRGIAAVNPQNPMGCFLSKEDLGFLEGQCRERGCALLLDEVFSEYGATSLPEVSKEVLSFRFGGISKSLGLPQLKLSWTILDGPPGVLAEAKERLEFIADSYLSLSTPVQKALPSLFELAPQLQGRIRQRLAENRRILEETFSELGGVKVWPSPGGWYGLLEVLASGQRDEELVEDLLRKSGILVHPGMFFDFPSGCFLVLGLLPSVVKFTEGAKGIRDYLTSAGLVKKRV